MKVWILTIHNKFGVSSFAYSNEKFCIDHLYDYVREWWYEVAFSDEDLECPKDQTEAIKMYFNNHPDNETANIEEIPILDKYE